MHDYQAHAKCKQLAEYTNKTKFFNSFHVMIIPAKESKFQILEDPNDIDLAKLRKDPKEFENWLASIKHKLKDCLTVIV
jgi:hypothetical protein